ncbi:PREDICTED: macrophage migration inhibitory factor homolog isoform X2 [Tarenaya hassleriana]|uniref:macrophage migration inhibitory factor homolog isoform X1 n=1 Tax=Tarenaya hassleriana TaxID=28532 RepID=UPI00053C1874|nr:PREDICTED: macrophage migration inhibitory factor homolog isoform X1 [Tarenaya hassleriana]XP_010545381.1 PREDICTED: macrophage migration inhibitory factor homolog isoform X2 [Tarenaya hassleriana]
MPTLNLFTNIPVDAVTASDILKDATKAVAKIIGKPESYVMILLNNGVPISFAGTEEPAAYGELISIGGLGPSVNGKLSSTISEILQTKLSIDSSRFYIKFYDSPTEQVQCLIFLLFYPASVLRVQRVNVLKHVFDYRK